jgi:hypothetical protein
MGVYLKGGRFSITSLVDWIDQRFRCGKHPPIAGFSAVSSAIVAISRLRPELFLDNDAARKYLSVRKMRCQVELGAAAAVRSYRTEPGISRLPEFQNGPVLEDFL